MPSSKSVELPISMQTTDTGTILSTKGLLDCSATDLFIHSDFIQRNKLTTKKLSRPLPVYNVDGTLNEAGSISEVWDAILRYHDHTEHATFTVTGLGNQAIILGLTWLCKHNPEVNWQLGNVTMSRCPNHCHTCLNKVNAERRILFMEAASIQTCHVGPLPLPDIDVDVPDLVNDCDDDDDDLYIGEDTLKDGDCIFVATVPCKAEFIRATSNVSQQLAEAFHKNTEPKSFGESVPTHLHDFEDLFAKSSFDQLPDRKIWDHTIELIPDVKPANCKVYPIAPNEQAELDEFLHKNLASGHIRFLKSPMASPVFFIKKKDGALLCRIIEP